jgi:hypothetical protein
VDGFDQEEDTSESDESGIVSLCFLTSHGHAFETLDLADQLLDPGAQLVEPLGEEFQSVLGRAWMRNDRDDETCPRIEVLSNIWKMPAVRLQPASA